MAILSSTGISGFLSSARKTGKQVLNAVGKLIPEYVEDFVSGFAGRGWKIWEYISGKWMLEIDSLRVRGTMTVFELLISKIRALVGSQAITQGCGKIKSVELSEDDSEYLITLEDPDMSFVEHDFVRCQEFSGGQKLYHVEISSVEGGVLHIPVTEFDCSYGEEGELLVSNPPEIGDDLVQFGNSSHDEQYAGRHSAIYMHADESMQPAIDVLDGIYSKDWSGCLKVRVGGDIPGSGGLKGFYCINGMLKGVDSSGHTTYCLYPDGTAELGDGCGVFRPDKSGHIAGGAIRWEWNEEKQKVICSMPGVTLTWANLDDEVQENLRGEAGKDGVSLVYRGELSSPPANPQNGWYYRNTTDKKSYVYQDEAWYVMTIDGVDGKNGKNGEDGLSVIWQGDLSVPPASPMKNWCYRDTGNGRVYIYNGSAWELMVADGSNGKDGTSGTDGRHVFITYHDSEAEPDLPTGEGTGGGWHTDATSSVVWMSQKVAESAGAGSWGAPIKIRGERGPQGLQGLQGDKGDQGIPGAAGASGATSYFHIKYSSLEHPTSASQMTETPSEYIGTYVDHTQADSTDPSVYTWARFRGLQGKQGEQGIPGKTGKDGQTSYLHIKYSNDGGLTFTDADGEVPGETPGDWIGTLVDFEKMDSLVPSDYTWKKIKGEPGDITNIPWLSEWNGYAQEVGDDYIVTPKFFSGIRDKETGKLTGIAQGKECLVDKDGNKRTGIFALVDDEVVFELDPITKRYLFKGRIEADEGYFTGEINATIGRIGEWKVTEQGLRIDGQSRANILLEMSGTKFCRIHENDFDAMLAVRNDDGDGIRIYTGSDSSIGLSITAQSGNGTAINSHGNHILHARRGEVIDLQGVVKGGYHYNIQWMNGGETVKNDTSVACLNWLDYDPTIYLPSQPYPGKLVRVISYNKRVYIHGNGHKIRKSGALVDSCNVGGEDRITDMIFDGYNWCYSCLNN